MRKIIPHDYDFSKKMPSLEVVKSNYD